MTVGEPSQSVSISLRRFGGAHAHRLVDAPGAELGEHSHDWPVLSIFVAGQVENRSESGTRNIVSPCVVLYGAGAPHSNSIGPDGFEEIQIEFDPKWLGPNSIQELTRPRHWMGRDAAVAARQLVGLWCNVDTSEAQLREASDAFLATAQKAEPRRPPVWVESAIRRLKEKPATSAIELGTRYGLNAHWVTQAYRSAVGEGIRETARRAKVEVAATMLRQTGVGAADIAAAAGFCDQSHMIRCFLSVLGRTPFQVRTEWQQARRSAAYRERSGS